MNRHCASLDRVSEASSHATTNTTMESKHPQAHFTARRYGDLCSAVMRVGDDIDDVALDEVFDESVVKLTTSIQKMFKRLASRFSGSPRLQAVFDLIEFVDFRVIFLSDEIGNEYVRVQHAHIFSFHVWHVC